MNLSKAWTPADYMNFHCKNNNSEYLKLQSFMEKHDISLKVAMHIALCEDRKGHEEFRLGEFKFSEEVDGEQLSICKETISYIRKVNGYSPFTGSARFWKALIALTSHESFNEKRWIANYKKLVDHFVPKPTGKGYLKCIQKIYNYNCSEKIILVD